MKHGIFVIFRANIISLVFSLLTNLLLPKTLSYGAYADIKTFQLYVSYVGLLHFGFADGMYLKYGGVAKDELDPASIKSDIRSMRIFQLVVTAGCLIVSIFLRDPIFIAFSLSVVPLNMASYFQLLFQATGEFQQYGLALNVTTAATFAVNMILLYLIRVRGSGIPYIILYLAVDVVVWIYLEAVCEKQLHLRNVSGRASFKIVRDNVKDGILLMLGNLSNIFFTGMDRWFVKFLMNTAAFAQYSFAVSMEGFLNVAVTPVSITLYNYFCNHSDRESVKNVQGKVLIFAAAIPACAFPAKFVLEVFLTKYIASAGVLFYLFAAQTYATITKCIHVNLYKAERRQTRYFVKLVLVLGIGFALNVICWLIMHDKTAFAIGTLFSNIIWFLLSVMDFPEVRPSWKEFLFLFLETILFMVLGLYCNAVIGLVGYIIGSIALGMLLIREDLRQMVQYIKQR
ncbi:MAG: hypothetical protein PUC44_00880 [Eubacteriales bacterium]|nr:hypothetical protein [Eubacteriales bacterium]